MAPQAYFADHAEASASARPCRHRCIRFRFASGIIYRWEFEKDGEAIEPVVDGPLILAEDRLVVEAALAGAAWLSFSKSSSDAAIADNRLVRVMEDWCPPFDGFHLYYPSRRQMRPALRALVDFFRWVR